jgi:hypothetical protein
MHRSVAIRALVLAALVTLPASYACSGNVGDVPQCEPDVTDAGIQIVDGGCSRFALCLNEAGNQVPVSECCKDTDGKPLTGDSLQLCLYSYGAASAPSGGSGGSTTTGSGGGGGSGGAGP